jgi:hypothetical protein
MLKKALKLAVYGGTISLVVYNHKKLKGLSKFFDELMEGMKKELAPDMQE